MSDNEIHYRAAEIQPGEGRTFRFIASDENPDSYGDIVRVDGWDLKRYKRNPIVLFGHSSSMPIGHTSKIGVEGKQLISDIKLAEEGTSDFIDTLFKLMHQRIVRAVSVGFRNTVPPNLIRDDKNDRILGFEFVGQELLEISVCSVPANPNTLSVAKSFGARDTTLNRMIGEDAIVQSAFRARRLRLLTLGASG